MIRGVIVIKGGAGTLARGLGDTMKEILAQLVTRWHRVTLPRHFDRDAMGRYHYKRRKSAYEKRKIRKFGHVDPLTWTGAMKREVCRRVDVSGTSRVARGTLHGPKYLYAYRTDAKQPDKAAELLATTHGEEKEMGQVVDGMVESWANGKLQRVPRFQEGVFAGSELATQVTTF